MVAAGKRATDFAKEFKSAFDDTEKELRDGTFDFAELDAADGF